MILKGFITRKVLTMAVIASLGVAAVVYFYAFDRGRSHVREKAAQSQVVVMKKSIATQQAHRAELNKAEKELRTKRFTYETIINNDPDTKSWADQKTSDCVFALSHGPRVHDLSSCAVPARPNTDSATSH